MKQLFIESYYKQFSVDTMFNYNNKTSFSVMLTTGFNPADIDQFRSHTGKKIYLKPHGPAPIIRTLVPEHAFPLKIK